MRDQMKWANALSLRPSLEAAIAEVVEQTQQQLAGVKADLAIVFISSAFASEYSRLMPLLQEKLTVPILIGCGGSGVVGMNANQKAQEIEEQPALSLTLAALPGVELTAFHISPDRLPDLDSSPDAWVELVGVSPTEEPQFILISDSFSRGINDLLQGLDFAYAGAVKVGGLTSGGTPTTGSGLFCNYQLYREGTVGVALRGNLVLETIVAQGCRPIGNVYRVIESEKNILLKIEALPTAEMGGNSKPRPPLEVLQDVVTELSEEDRQLAQHSLFVGVATDGFKLTLEHGDFLIRNLLGVDPRVGAIAIGDRVRSGQRIQFHLRDAQASAQDLEMLLKRYCQQQAATPPAASPTGVLMFSCVGRGESLYGYPHFDSRLLQRYLGDVPLAGFFGNGEIGPVGGSTFLHGYTSVFGICRQPQISED